MKKLTFMIVLLLLSPVWAATPVPVGTTDVNLVPSTFVVIDTSGDEVTGLTDANFTTSYYSAADGYVAVTCTGHLIEIDDTNRPGEYSMDWVAADGNCVATAGIVTLGYLPNASNTYFLSEDIKVGPVEADITKVDGVAAAATTMETFFDVSTAADNLHTFWATANAATYMVEMMITDHGTNYDGSLNMWVVDANKVAGTAPASQTDLETYAETGCDASIDANMATVITAVEKIDTNSELRTLLYGSDTAGATATALSTASGYASDAKTAAEKIDTNTELRTLLYGSDTAGATAANQSTIIADTNELQTDWANGGRLDLILDTAASAGTDANELRKEWNDGGRLDLILDTAASGAGFYSTTVSSATDTKTFVIADGVVFDNVYKGLLITVTDANVDDDPEPAFVARYASGTKTITLVTSLSFEPESGDTVVFYPCVKQTTPWSR